MLSDPTDLTNPTANTASTVPCTSHPSADTAAEPDATCTQYSHHPFDSSFPNKKNKRLSQDEDAASDGWEDILHGYEGDKSDADLE